MENIEVDFLLNAGENIRKMCTKARRILHVRILHQSRNPVWKLFSRKKRQLSMLLSRNKMNC
jgi:hypothetical protein